MTLKDWKKTTNEKRYVVWSLIDNRIGNYNRFSLVAKTEEGRWVVFLSAGTFEASKILSHFVTKSQALAFAKKYMRSH